MEHGKVPVLLVHEVTVVEGGLLGGVLEVEDLGFFIPQLRFSGIGQIFVHIEDDENFAYDEETIQQVVDVLNELFEAIRINNEEFVVDCKAGLPKVCICTVWCNNGAMVAQN